MKKRIVLLVTLVLTAVFILSCCTRQSVENTSPVTGDPTSTTISDTTLPDVDSTLPPDVTLAPTEVPTATPDYFDMPTPSAAPGVLDVGSTTPINTPPADYAMKYFVEVDLNNQVVNIYTFEHNTPKLINRLICSSGLVSGSTPVGTYYIPRNGQNGYSTTKFVWGYFNEFDVWARYLTRIKGGILFHSIIYAKKDVSTVKLSTYNRLGDKASHGCIRLAPIDAKWIYDNIPVGSFISITDKIPKDSELRALMRKNKPPYGATGATVSPSPSPTITPNPSVKGTSTKTITPKPTPSPTEEPLPTEAPTLATPEY